MIAAGIFVLAVLSGALGLGVAFAAIPFLSFFDGDLINSVQPLALLLNGVTATTAAVGFALAGKVPWRKALALLAVTTALAPLGGALAPMVPVAALWTIYLVAVAFLAYRLFRPTKQQAAVRPLWWALGMAAPIAVLSAMLGVGPGFLLMPALVWLGWNVKEAAGATAVAVTLPSFTALLPRLDTMEIDAGLTATLLTAGAAGAFLGARFSATRLGSTTLKRLFGVTIVLATAVRLVTL